MKHMSLDMSGRGRAGVTAGSKEEKAAAAAAEEEEEEEVWGGGGTSPPRSFRAAASSKSCSNWAWAPGNMNQQQAGKKKSTRETAPQK